MKFGLRNLILFVTLVAIFFALFQNGNEVLGRHLLILFFWITASMLFGALVSKPKGMRFRCAIGCFIGVCVYGLVAYLLKIPFYHSHVQHYGSRYPLLLGMDFACRRYWLDEISVVAMMAWPLGATLGPFLLILTEKHVLSEQAAINRNISGVLLGLSVLTYFLATFDSWHTTVFRSNWFPIFALLACTFAIFSFPWIGEHFRSTEQAK